MVDLHRLTELVIEALRRRLPEMAGASDDGPVLWLVCPGPDELVGRVEEVLHHCGEIVRLHGEESDFGSWLERVQSLVVAPCDQSILAQGALGLTFDVRTARLAEALWRSRPLSLILRPELSPIFQYGASVHPYRRVLRDYAESLRRYGADVVAWEEFVGGWRPPAPASWRRNPEEAPRGIWWTAGDLIRRNFRPGDVLTLPEEVKLTPLAREWLREMDVVVKQAQDEEKTGP